MTKNDLVRALAKRLSQQLGRKVSLREANLFLSDFSLLVRKQLEAHKSVLLTGLGKFYVGKYKPRKGRNPQTGDALIIPAHYAARVKISHQFNKKLNK